MTYDDTTRFSNDEERQITRSGFQMQLQKLFNEQAMHIKVHGATIVLSNGSEKLFSDPTELLKRRSMEACNFTIQQIENRKSSPS
ncbi:hypothetical protein [Galbibacter marinus]|nr:hypothetical protein [Galbibacter marinus]